MAGVIVRRSEDRPRPTKSPEPDFSRMPFLAPLDTRPRRHVVVPNIVLPEDDRNLLRPEAIGYPVLARLVYGNLSAAIGENDDDGDWRGGAAVGANDADYDWRDILDEMRDEDEMEEEEE